ncbi:MAG: bifunctional metallophosphatase/5'-nucleotidase [Solobacterium sp.]|nr:bifunctional metallophosphatase/5'-nucleotidase [Solobacterium sp.]
MKRIIQKILLALTLAAAASCTAKKQLSDDIYIFFTSDVHCGVNDNLGLPAVKELVDEAKAEHEYVFLTDLGDYIQGGTLGSMTKGESVIRIMNAMGYDAVTLGNHEFDYGMEQLGILIGMMDFDLVVSNITYTGSGTDIFSDVPAYVIRDCGGVRVAFIGVVTPISLTSSTPAYFMEDGEFVYDFAGSEDGLELAETVQRSVDAARKEGADYVILLSHLGASDYFGNYSSVYLIHNTRGIDAVLDGHAHVVIAGEEYPNADGENVLLASVGTKTENCGELIIGKDGTISCVLVSEYDKTDEKVQAVIDAENENLEGILSRKVCGLDFDMPITDGNGYRISRSRETTVGNLLADAFREVLGADVAVMNGGNVRSALTAGDVPYRNLLDIMPFQNSGCVCRASGQQILDALEYGAQNTETITGLDDKPAGESGGFLSVSGLRYTVDTSVPTSVTKDENGVCVGIEGERRVQDVYILQDGEYVPVDPEAFYTVASIDYVIKNSGDGNTAFSGAELVLSDGPVDVNILIRYINDHGGIPDRYRQTEGRITVK